MLRVPTNRPILAYFDAIKNLRLRQLALILKAGYDPNLMVNARGQNGLQYMINYFWATDAHFRLQAPINKAAYLSIAKLLLDSGLDPNSFDMLTGESPIFDAIRFNDRDMVSLMLNYADFSLRNKDGETALMCAARFGSKQVMRMVLEHLHQLDMDGYFLRQRNRFGLTALELARAENLECAKVLTKHLITYGHHTGSVLTRSTSHHQLVPRTLPYHMRPAAMGGYGAGRGGQTAAAAAAVMLDDSGDEDYESSLLAGGGGYGPMRPHQTTGHPAARVGYRAAAYYDPKAAEFSQYLMEQQEMVAAEQQQQQQQQQQLQHANVSDEDDNNNGAYYGTGDGSGGSGLTRSRSCMLGPPGSSSKQQKYSQPGKKGGGVGGQDGKAVGPPGWADPTGTTGSSSMNQ